MDLKVINHSPTVNQSDVYLNETIKIYFNQPIEETSIKWDNFSVNDNYSFATIVGEIGPIWESGVNLSGVTSGLAFIPTVYMLPNTEYSVYVFGKPNSVLAKDGSEINQTYTYSFVTGTGYYDSIGTTGTPSGVTSETDIELSGILDSEESSITSFEVYSTTPKNKQSNINMSTINDIKIYFTGNITTPVDTLSGMITIDRLDVI
jgi:hypothetical protein